MNITMSEMVLYSVLPNLNFLEVGTEFIVQDLVPPIFWKQYTDHKGIGMVFSELIKQYQLPVVRINKSGTAIYRKNK